MEGPACGHNAAAAGKNGRKATAIAWDCAFRAPIGILQVRLGQ